MDEIECVGRIRGSAAGPTATSSWRRSGRLGRLRRPRRRGLDGGHQPQGPRGPGPLERIPTWKSRFGRPDLRGAKEIFHGPLARALPYRANGEPAARGRQAMIEQAVSRLLAPNAATSLHAEVPRRQDPRRRPPVNCSAAGPSSRSADGPAEGLPAGRSPRGGRIAARGHGRGGLRHHRADGYDAHAAEARVYLADLPQDIDVVAVEPLPPPSAGTHRVLEPRITTDRGNPSMNRRTNTTRPPRMSACQGPRAEIERRRRGTGQFHRGPAVSLTAAATWPPGCCFERFPVFRSRPIGGIRYCASA